MDGKQRLESILLFIGDEHKNLKIPNWKNYFADHSIWREGMFEAKWDDKNKLKFSTLSDDEIREFREYLVPIIEITLEDETTPPDGCPIVRGFRTVGLCPLFGVKAPNTGGFQRKRKQHQ